MSVSDSSRPTVAINRSTAPGGRGRPRRARTLRSRRRIPHVFDRGPRPETQRGTLTLAKAPESACNGLSPSG